MFLAIGCSNVATGGGVAPGSWWGQGVFNSKVGGNSPVGGGGKIAVVGGQQWGCLQPLKNRPSHHKYKSRKQFELKQSWKSLRALNSRWALPVYSVFEDEKSKASDEIGQAKNRIKKTDRTNIIATNFVWEQLKTKKEIFCNTLRTHFHQKGHPIFTKKDITIFTKKDITPFLKIKLIHSG